MHQKLKIMISNIDGFYKNDNYILLIDKSKNIYSNYNIQIPSLLSSILTKRIKSTSDGGHVSIPLASRLALS